MKKRALALAVVGACGLLPQAFAHELAVSKKDHIKVDVPGEASNWCKPEIELTIRRPVWDNQALLTGLVGKLPTVLANDCPAARVTWRAVDASGNLYASGSGTAANLGIVTLASAKQISSPAVLPSNSSVEASALVDQTVQREQQRLLEERRVQQHMAELHSRVLDRYEQLKAGMKDYEGKEVEALAQMAGIQVRFGSPLALQDPNSSKSVGLMMIHVVGKTDGSYDIDFPAKGRLLSNQTFEKEWYVVPVANLTPFMPLVDGRALPTFRGNLPAAPEACKQDHCADKVSFGAVLAREFGPDSGIDFNWTPDVSQQYVNTWKNASAQLQ